MRREGDIGRRDMKMVTSPTDNFSESGSQTRTKNINSPKKPRSSDFDILLKISTRIN